MKKKHLATWMLLFLTALAINWISSCGIDRRPRVIQVNHHQDCKPSFKTKVVCKVSYECKDKSGTACQKKEVCEVIKYKVGCNESTSEN